MNGRKKTTEISDPQSESDGTVGRAKAGRTIRAHGRGHALFL